MAWRLVKALLILPGTMLVLVPALLLRGTGGTAWAPEPVALGDARFWAALFFAALGAGLGVSAMALFVREGRGTPAPWDPPLRLVVRGPYRHVRNPMITGVLLLMAAEALAAGSWAIALWGAVFFVGNALYFPLVEEKALEARFGRPYRLYKENVPRWLPRIRPWPSKEAPGEGE